MSFKVLIVNLKESCQTFPKWSVTRVSSSDPRNKWPEKEGSQTLRQQFMKAAWFTCLVMHENVKFWTFSCIIEDINQVFFANVMSEVWYRMAKMIFSAKITYIRPWYLIFFRHFFRSKHTKFNFSFAFSNKL